MKKAAITFLLICTAAFAQQKGSFTGTGLGVKRSSKTQQRGLEPRIRLPPSAQRHGGLGVISPLMCLAARQACNVLLAVL